MLGFTRRSASSSLEHKEPCEKGHSPASLLSLLTPSVHHPKTATQAAQIFAEWMRDNGYIDYLTAAELDMAYLDYCKEAQFLPWDTTTIRLALRKLEGVYYGRQRIAGRRWERLRKRVHNERPVLYRVLGRDEMT